jgi:hypothetical protein
MLKSPVATPGMGVNLWGESPLYMNTVLLSIIIAKVLKVLAEGKGDTVRCRLARGASACAARGSRSAKL